jgi:hypothetical protein
MAKDEKVNIAVAYLLNTSSFFLLNVNYASKKFYNVGAQKPEHLRHMSPVREAVR